MAFVGGLVIGIVVSFAILTMTKFGQDVLDSMKKAKL